MRKATQAIIIGSVFCFLRPNIKNKQPSKNPTLGASEPSISGAPVALNEKDVAFPVTTLNVAESVDCTKKFEPDVKILLVKPEEEGAKPLISKFSPESCPVETL